LRRAFTRAILVAPVTDVAKVTWTDLAVRDQALPNAAWSGEPVAQGPSPVPSRGWYSDPIGLPDRMRFWDGAAWTARVTPLGLAATGLAWRPELERLAPPPWAPDSEAPVVEAGAVTQSTSDLGAALGVTPCAVTAQLPPTPAVDDVFWGEEHPRQARRRATAGRQRSRRLSLLAVGAFVVLGAVAGAGVLSSGGRPELAPATTYRDAAAGFTLRYPDGWKVADKTPAAGLRFEIAAPGATPSETNTVSVAVGPTAAGLPPLDTLAAAVTQKLQSQFPGLRLESADRTQLLGAPAIRLAFADVSDQPATEIVQYAGRTTAGRPFSVTTTVREPRTAPTTEQVRRFLDSIEPA
jgi:hypothetical protein